MTKLDRRLNITNHSRRCSPPGAAVVLMAVVLAIAGILGSTTSRAQSMIPGLSGETEAEGNQLEKYLDQARQDGATVIVIAPDGEQEQTEDPMIMPTSSEQLLRARWAFMQIIQDSPNFFDSIGSLIRDASPDGTHNWLIRAIVTAIAGIIAGIFAAKLLQRWLRSHFAYVYNPNPETRADKIGFLLFRAFMILLQTLLLFGIAVLVAVIFDTEWEPARRTIFEIVTAFVIYRAARYVVLLNFFVPDHDNHRMINLTGEEARRVYWDWIVVLWILVPMAATMRWLFELGLNQNNAKLLLMAVMATIAIMLSGLTIKHRDYIAKIILGPGNPDDKSPILIFASRIAMFVVLGYLIVALAFSIFRVSLSLQTANPLIAVPILIGLIAIASYGLAVVIIDRIYERRERRFRMLAAVEAEKEAWRQMLEQFDSSGEPMAASPQEDKPAEYRPLFKPLFEHAAVIAILVFSVGETARLWGVDVGREGHPLTAFLDIVLVVYLAYLSYRAVNIYVNHKIVEEGGSLESNAGEPGEGEGGGQGESRLVTLLPIFRNVMVVTIAIISGMIVLSQMGVNIGPLFAGAGVIGIAVGFGAQTLIRDIFSGAFYLIDDAFRKGEYIELDNIRGTVEKISMRSFQLRHHLGALHTIPFGEIHQLTNYSRDWVVMKLPLRVTYDTDVERVRKLVKKLGQELLDHPQVGKLFIQPLKSQGVIQMEDSAMIIRVKFMTKPGEQWVVRKVVYAAVRELFEREGIKFAHKEVTVRLAGDRDPASLSDKEREAVGAAARNVIDADEAAQKGEGTLADVR